MMTRMRVWSGLDWELSETGRRATGRAGCVSGGDPLAAEATVAGA
jgi:hypothetical protein